ncbi:MAG: hypothetical protein H6739_29910 [Alphaproteobacteria bacterium]|nr:hypothetical protein [Alphaproteobacteria bacterium]
MTDGLRFELMIGGRVVGPVASISAFTPPPRPDWTLRLRANDPQLVSVAVQQLRQAGVTRLALTGVNDASLLPVAALPQLEALSLDAPGLTDEGLSPLAELRQLEALTLTFSQVQGPGLAAIADLEGLRALRIADAPLTGEALPHIGRLTGLTALTLNGAPLDGVALASLAGLTRLKALSLRGCAPGHAGLEFLWRLRALEALNLAGEQGITDDELAPLAGLSALQQLLLTGRRGVRGPGLRHLSELAHLRILDLSGAEIVHAHLRHLAGLGLTHLRLARNPLWDLDAVRRALEGRSEDDVAARMTLSDAWPTRYEMRWEEGYGDFTVEFLPPEAPIPALSEDDLVPVVDPMPAQERLQRLREAAALYDLDLDAVTPPLTGLSALGTLSGLRVLDLSDTPVRPEDLAADGPRWPALATLELARTGVDDLAPLALPAGLVNLDLSGCPDLPRLLAGLPPGVQTLRIGGGRLGPAALAPLGRLAGLHSLQVHGSALVDGALRALSGGALRVLILHACTLEDAGLGGLAALSTLEALDLSRSALSEADRASLGDLTQLHHLNLNKTGVTDRDVVGFAAFEHLRWLGLAFTEVSPEVILQLAEALPQAAVARSIKPDDAPPEGA